MTPTREDKLKEILERWQRKTFVAQEDEVFCDTITDSYLLKEKEILDLVSLAYDAALEEAVVKLRLCAKESWEIGDSSGEGYFQTAAEELLALKEVKP